MMKVMLLLVMVVMMMMVMVLVVMRLIVNIIIVIYLNLCDWWRSFYMENVAVKCKNGCSDKIEIILTHACTVQSACWRLWFKQQEWQKDSDDGCDNILVALFSKHLPNCFITSANSKRGLQLYQQTFFFVSSLVKSPKFEMSPVFICKLWIPQRQLLNNLVI